MHPYIPLFASMVSLIAPPPIPRPMEQVPPSLAPLNKTRVTWDGERLITVADFRSANPTVSMWGPTRPAVARSIEVEGVCPGSLIHAQGQLWCLKVIEDTQERRADFRKSHEGKRWESVGQFKAKNDALPDVAIPLGNGRVLGIHTNGIEDEDDSSPFGLYEAGADGTFQLRSVYELGLKATWKVKHSAPPARPYWVFNPALHAVGGTSDELSTGVVVLQDWIVVVHGTTGLLWVFDSKTGHLKRHSMLYPGGENRLNNLSSIECALLLWQPTRMGSILMASRTEDGFLLSRKLTEDALGRLGPHPALPLEKKDDPEAQMVFRQNLEAFRAKASLAQRTGLLAHPGILWWEFDPATGKFESAAPPKGAPSRLTDIGDLSSLRLTPKPDGTFQVSYKAEDKRVPSPRPAPPTPTLR